jgi:hypothetical protein
MKKYKINIGFLVRHCCSAIYSIELNFTLSVYGVIFVRFEIPVEKLATEPEGFREILRSLEALCRRPETVHFEHFSEKSCFPLKMANFSGQNF